MNTPALLMALAIVESANNPLAIGDDGKSWGLYQIRPEYVADVNRILGSKQYRHRDAFNPAAAGRMVEIYIGHYATPRRIGGMDPTEAAARIHNGGPNGHRKAATIEYWHKVRKGLRE